MKFTATANVEETGAINPKIMTIKLADDIKNAGMGRLPLNGQKSYVTKNIWFPLQLKCPILGA